MAADREVDTYTGIATSPKAALARGRSGNVPLSSRTAAGSGLRLATADIESSEIDGRMIVQRRHVDWLENYMRWQWLMDSLEGGQRYRDAIYGQDRRGMPNRNLFRHKREYPDPMTPPQYWPNAPVWQMAFTGWQTSYDVGMLPPFIGPLPGQLGADPAATAMDSDYELRRSRTPVPEFVAETIDIHLSKIYDQEVSRRGPPELEAWWKDVDGTGVGMDDFMRETVAPLLLVLGVLDIVLDYPRALPGQMVATQADEAALGLNRVVASYILPTNLVWWRVDHAWRYTECLVREYVDPSERMDYDKNGNAIDPSDPSKVGENWRRNFVRWRYWNDRESILFNYNGDEIDERIPHRFGRVPIVRLQDQKKFRTRMVGQSRYEGIAEIMREYYNRDSELILNDSLQAHPFLSGPEELCRPDGSIAVGPSYILPKKKDQERGTYEGFEYVSPPKDPAESLRRNKDDLIHLKDRRGGVVRPAGIGTMGTIGQSGLSKELDSQTGYKILSSICRTMAKAERLLSGYALLVLNLREPTPLEQASIRIEYPSKFELHSATDLIENTTKLQVVMAQCGNAPNTERELIQQSIRQLLLGMSDEEYALLDLEIEKLVESKNAIAVRTRDLQSAGVESEVRVLEGEGSAESAGEEMVGQAGASGTGAGVGYLPGI
jgi:hypothetical protein